MLNDLRLAATLLHLDLLRHFEALELFVLVGLGTVPGKHKRNDTREELQKRAAVRGRR